METRQVLLVDAFADQPTGGRPVVVVPGDQSLTGTQRRAVASEFGACGVVTQQAEQIVYTERDGSNAIVEAGVASCAGLYKHGSLEAGTHALSVENSALAEEHYTLDLRADGSVEVAVPTQEFVESPVTLEAVATTLDIDIAALQDIGADLPVARADGFGGSLLVPVNFLEHLAGSAPDPASLRSLLVEAEADRLFAFTFDTLGSDADVHGRTFAPAANACEYPTSGVAAAACGSHLSQHAVFDDDTTQIEIECGHFLDRPGTIVTTLELSPHVVGSALTVVDTELAIPESDDDGIIEV